MESHIKYSKGVCWIGDCRIPFVDEGDMSYGIENKKEQKIYGGGNGFIRGVYNPKTEGRFTPNLLVCDDMLNDGSVSKSVKSKRGGVVDSNSGTYSWNIGNTEKIENYMCGVDDKGSNSRYYNLDLWFDKMLERL